MKLLFIFILSIATAFAKSPKIENKFSPEHWTTGLHLAAGGGFNATYFNANDLFDKMGYGLNFKTDLGYYFTHNFAIEWSSDIKLNKVDQLLIWDTLITGGLRYRIKDHYIRGFYGKAPTVVYFNHHPPEEFKNSKASRLQFDGPVYGVAYGKMFKKDSGLIWFLETSVTYQKLQEREAIHMDGEVPEVLSRENDPSTALSLYFMIGALIF